MRAGHCGTVWQVMGRLVKGRCLNECSFKTDQKTQPPHVLRTGSYFPLSNDSTGTFRTPPNLLMRLYLDRDKSNQSSTTRIWPHIFATCGAPAAHREHSCSLHPSQAHRQCWYMSISPSYEGSCEEGEGYVGIRYRELRYMNSNT